MQNNFQVPIESIVLSNNKIEFEKFFEQTFYKGVKLYRFVDDMEGVDWEAIGKQIGRSVGECKSQYQYILDTLFGRQQFTIEDRNLLYKVITGQRKFKLTEQEGMGSQMLNSLQITQQIPLQTLQTIQKEYFPQYSTEVINMELIAVMENFKLFIKESGTQGVAQ